MFSLKLIISTEFDMFSLMEAVVRTDRLHLQSNIITDLIVSSCTHNTHQAKSAAICPQGTMQFSRKF